MYVRFYKVYSESLVLTEGGTEQLPDTQCLLECCFNQVLGNVCETEAFAAAYLWFPSVWGVAPRYLKIGTQMFETSMLPGNVGHQHPVAWRHIPEEPTPQLIK
jgi:hypothetical protein